jgi:hypothetical protein
VARAPQGIVPISKKVRPRKPPTGVVRPTGQHRFGVTNNPVLLGGPGRNPYGGFVMTGNNSLEEWPIYWACLKLLGPPVQGVWQYQAVFGKGTPGGSKPDFVLYSNPLRPVVIRVQSAQYHVKADSWKAAYDYSQRAELEKQGFTVVDVYPQYYIVDNYAQLTAQASISTTQDAMRGVQRADPRATRSNYART